MKYSALSLLVNAFTGHQALATGLAGTRSQARIRRGDRRRRRPRAGDRLLSGGGARHRPGRGPGEKLARLRQRRAQHHHHPLQLHAAGNGPFYEWSLKLWEKLEREFNFNAMVSQRGVLNLHHSDPQRDAFARRGNAMHMHGVDGELLDRRQVKELVPFLDFDNARFPIHGGLFQRRGGTVRHDAVAWGYARGADRGGADIIQNCEVLGISMAGGAVAGVETSKGFIECRKLGLAAAGNSSEVARRAPSLCRRTPGTRNPKAMSLPAMRPSGDAC